ncbi:MAG: DNA polymerase III subunit delta' [Bdellovibrionales bacterium]
MVDIFAQHEAQDCANLAGHSGAARQVAEAFRAGRMHHAWLLTGMEGIGKATFALSMGAFALSGGKGEPDRPMMADKQVQHALAETHPDMLMIRRAVDEKTGVLKQGIVVEEASRVGAFLHKTSSHGGWRVVIIDEAHTLNRNAQNAILKILEEPPARAMIIMTVTMLGAMLPTIRSRCRVLQFASLDEQTMRDLLQRHAKNLSDSDTEKLLALSGGSIGKALRILKTEALESYEEMLALFDGLPQLDLARLHKLADKIAPKAESETFEVATELFLEKLRKNAVEAARKEGHGIVRRKLDSWEITCETLAAADHANLDKKLALVNALCALKKVG